MPQNAGAERSRLANADTEGWRTWGPYLSDRAWGTVREDYSAEADPWNYFSHDEARMRAYRWGEDGLGGYCDNKQNLCLAPAFWNEQDPILKERYFGLINGEGNHGEDVKELYHYLDCTPTGSYSKMLYRYPQVAYPYGQLIQQNQSAGMGSPEVELFDMLRDAFERGLYFDIAIEYAKRGPDDLLCRIRATNRGPTPAPLHILPQLWYRNYWSWEAPNTPPSVAPELSKAGRAVVQTSDQHPFLGRAFWYVADDRGSAPELLFTNNESHDELLGWGPGRGKFFKDGFHLSLVARERARADAQLGRQSSPSDWVNPAQRGSKAAAHFSRTLAPGETWEVRVRYCTSKPEQPFEQFTETFAQRISEADAFYAELKAQGPSQGSSAASADRRLIQRQALAGLLWNQQFYYYNVERWLKGDPGEPAPPANRRHPHARNTSWGTFDAMDVLLMPDPWEYPWFAAWDLAFHSVAISLVDPDLAKKQILLLLREYYMNPNGQIPAYEWEFSDVNPPVTAWAALQIYQAEKKRTGKGDRTFLARVFEKALLNFTWWVNREDAEGDNLFSGGFLGLDNISVLDRSSLPGGYRIEQADGTGWVAMYCANMFAIASELALTDPEYQDLAVKFLDHYTYIARALINPQQIRPELEPLWDATDGFYYDHLYPGDGQDDVPLRIRSVAGLVPLFSVATVDPSTWAALPELAKHRSWLIQNRQELLASVAPLDAPGNGDRTLLSLLTPDMLRSVLNVVLDERRLLSPYGVRSLSKEHQGADAFSFRGKVVRYDPAEASYDPLKGGNSNWRGPIWVAVNYLLVSSLRTLASYHGDSLKVPLRDTSGKERSLTLAAAADEIGSRVIKLFLSENGERPIYRTYPLFKQAGWRDTLLLHEYFDADTGKGLGAGHQGWTSLIANLIEELA
jgi:hypothetical protein